MKFPTHVHTISTTLLLYEISPFSKHCHLIWFKQNPFVRENIIKSILQMKKLKLIEIESVSWGHKVGQNWTWNPSAWLWVHDPFCSVMLERDAGSSQWGDVAPILQKFKNQETCPRSHIMWAVVEPELDSRSPGSVVQVFLNDHLTLPEWMGNCLQRENHLEKLSIWVSESPKSGYQESIEGYSSSISCNVGTYTLLHLPTL